jgi:hypothetical protein
VTPLLTPVRYGDIRPGSTNERIFTAFYVIFGIFLLSAAIASISAAIYGHYNAMVEERFARMALRMQQEKSLHSSVDIEAPAAATTTVSEEQTSINNHEQKTQNVLNFLDMVHSPSVAGAEHQGTSASFKQRIISGVEGITAKMSVHIHPGAADTLQQQQQQQHDQKILDTLQTLNLEMFDEDLQDMRKTLFHTFTLIVLVMAVGWVSMLLIEDWNTGDSFYWSVVTITTVGFGDIVPTSNAGKVFTMVYGLVGCAVLANGLNTLVAYPLTKQSKQSELRVMLQFGGHLSKETLQNILANDLFERMPNLRNNPESVSRSEFILLVLSMMNKTYDKDLLIISSIFDVLDKNRVGSLSAQTLELQDKIDPVDMI